MVILHSIEAIIVVVQHTIAEIFRAIPLDFGRLGVLGRIITNYLLVIKV